MTTILYLTDVYYEAKGRKYYEEDLYITSRLKEHFNILIGHPQQALSFIDCADVIVFRNTGPVIYYKPYFDRFLAAVKEKNIPTFNSFDGKADIKGKLYLLELTDKGFPVIPTVDNLEDLPRPGNTVQYIVKLKDGADSIGMETLTKEDLLQKDLSGKLIQPLVNFEYEVSFYYLNNQFQYALYAPDKQKRWMLQEYTPTSADLLFTEKFLRWNALARGIVRVDACRIKNNELLLVEMEDLNPFLSIDLLNEQQRAHFIQNFINALKNIKGN